MASRLPLLRQSLRGTSRAVPLVGLSKWGSLEAPPLFLACRRQTGQAWPAPPGPPSAGSAASIFSSSPSSPSSPSSSSSSSPFPSPPSAPRSGPTPPPSASAARAASAPISQTPAAAAPAAAAGEGEDELPKRPPTAWLRFLSEYRKQQDLASLANAMKEASAQWKAMSKEEKAPYVEEYEAEKKLYDEKMAVLNPTKKAKKEPKDKKAKKAKKAARDPEKPKRPLSAYLRFSQEVRPTLTDVPGNMKIKTIAERWKDLPKSEQEKYAPSVAEKDAYEAAMQAYKASGKEAAFKEAAGKESSKEGKKAGKKAANK